jgi:hypothetical protein
VDGIRLVVLLKDGSPLSTSLKATSFPLGTPRCIKTTIHLERTRVSVLHSYTLPSLYRKHQLSGKSQYLRLRWKKGHGRGHRPQQGTGFFILFRAPTLT